MGADEHDEVLAVGRQVLASLPRDARAADGAWQWDVVSSGLRELHASLRVQLAAQEAEYERVDEELRSLETAFPADSERLEQQVDGLLDEIQRLLPELDGADAHFGQVMALIEPATQQLETLQAKAKYLATALDVEKHSQHVKKLAEEATADALDAFQAFAAFVQTIPTEYKAIQQEAGRRLDALSMGLKTFAVEKLQHALDAVEWPTGFASEQLEDKAAEFAQIGRAFDYVVTLQASQRLGETGETTEDPGFHDLWAMDCVLEPFRLRFRYHFERTESKTNRLTKPEWYLSHVLDQTRAHADFFTKILTPQLEKHRAIVDCIDAQLLFLRGLIRMAMKKLESDWPTLLMQRAVLCHTLDEVLLFEQTLDDEFGYDSYATSQRSLFPRCVDVLTADTSRLFAWTKIDVDFAQETIKELMKEDAWHVADGEESKTPEIAQQFMTMLDFLCRRFAYMYEEEHRYMYITQVHFVLLQQFRQACRKRARSYDVPTLLWQGRSLDNLFLVVNGLQHVVDVLSAWDQSSLFLELMRKVADSDKSRSQVLKMHVQYSKTVLKNAAKVASETIMAREEAVAVRQAIAGPGSMIGPTAALSAAYSVGSKTMKSLFGRQQGVEAVDDSEPSVQSPRHVTTDRRGSVDAGPTGNSEVDDELLLFSRTMFDRHITEYKALITTILRDIQDGLLDHVRRALNAYRMSSHWTQDTFSDEALLADLDVSSELGGTWTRLHQVLTAAKCLLVGDSLGQLWKPLVAAIDDAVLAAATNATTAPIKAPTAQSSTFSLTGAVTAIGAVAAPHAVDNRVWSVSAKKQFVVDTNALAVVFQGCAKNPKAYLRKAFDLNRLVEMDESKLADLRHAIGFSSTQDGPSMEMEQITTMLEARNILTLSPQQVMAFCVHQLGAQ
ncbi:hypothetical protein Poli38472_011799 [Pythium oligandrum]|uniref:Uncharacterized protein n=1 Tax=Pythium oligandrum TaxID=41045 RepID=A0A8K1C886_PYTOL|nr:hypothetical protein Poli38472_011799 [Pythium oligandrum]|eukprot:TMW58211.1 hypothetical protein Poli38472_011799 [Pythium oligandrum]